MGGGGLAVQQIKELPGGVTTIYTGTGCAIFWGTFLRAENKFWGIIFLKSQVVINFGVLF